MARILIVDDEENIRRMLRLALEFGGHTIGQAQSGAEASRSFGDGHNWDIVLLDYRLEDTTGLDVVERLRSRDPEAWIILMTAAGTVDLTERAREMGVNDFLRKPFTTQALRTAIDAALHGRRPLQQNEGLSMAVRRQTRNGWEVARAWAGEGNRTTWAKRLQQMLHLRPQGGIARAFVVTSPDGLARDCTVALSAEATETITLLAGQQRQGEVFWTEFCEAVLIDFLERRTAFPPEEGLLLNEPTPEMRRWLNQATPAAVA
jgi:DNA-binding response OmpR family regulator